MTEKKDLENVLNDTGASLDNIIKEARADIGPDLDKLSEESRKEVEDQISLLEDNIGSELRKINIKKLIKMAKKKKKTRFRDIKKRR